MTDDTLPSPGPFFAVRADASSPGRSPAEEGYVPLAEVYHGELSVLRRRIGTVAEALGTRERRIAASIAHQGLAARLWSVALGPDALSGRLPPPAAEHLWWHPGRTAPDDLWLSGAYREPWTPGGVVLTGHLEPLARATRDVCRVSDRLLWGNAASALVGTLRVLHAWCHRHGRRAAWDRAWSVGRELLTAPPLAGTGTVSGGSAAAPPSFRRRSCCLYYRVPGGGLCGDCVFTTRAPASGSTGRRAP